MRYPVTPDRRYFVVKGQLWRCSNPNLDEDTQKQLVQQLMAARRAVKAALKSGDAAEVRSARQQVNDTKVALGERGPVWWSDGAPDYNQKSVKNTPYADWFVTELAEFGQG
jgi:hypothetical protein